MKSYYFDDWNVAEMIYNFCSDDRIYSDLQKHCQSEDLSLSEYVYQYRFKEFQRWALKRYSVYIQPCRDDL